MKMLDLLQGDGVAIEIETGQRITYALLRQYVNDHVEKWSIQHSSCILNHQVVVIQSTSLLQQIVSIFACFHLGMIVNVDGDPELLHAQWVCRDGDLQSTGFRKREYGPEVDALFLTSGTTEESRSSSWSC